MTRCSIEPIKMSDCDFEEDWTLVTSFKQHPMPSFKMMMGTTNSKKCRDSFVFHYTGLKYFSLIVRGSQFKMSRYDLMRNDINEGTYIYDVFKEVCGEYRDILTEPTFSALSQIGNKDFEAFMDDTNTIEEVIPYVVCFCCDGQSSKMFKDYQSDVAMKIYNIQSFPYLQ